MRWNYTQPQNGDNRHVVRFVLIPRECNRGHKHWLEALHIVDKWHYGFGWDEDCCICPDIVEEIKRIPFTKKHPDENTPTHD